MSSATTDGAERTAADAPAPPDQEALDAFLARFVADLGATTAAAGVVTGHRLGLYRALAQGPASAEELAGRTGTHPRPVLEWLHGQAAGGYVGYDSAPQTRPRRSRRELAGGRHGAPLRVARRGSRHRLQLLIRPPAGKESSCTQQSLRVAHPA